MSGHSHGVMDVSGHSLTGAKNPKGCAPAPAQESWRLEPHICRVCHSRLASRDDGGARRYECTNCGAHAHGHEASVLCCCGMKIRRPNRNGTSGYVMVDAGIRCCANDNPTPEFPSLFVATEGNP